MTKTQLTRIGYAISSEEHKPNDIVRYAQQAEDIGFSFALISDHFHPWLDVQGQSPFVWAVIGGIAQATKNLRLGTGVTCPMIRTHPAIIAQATATVATMMPERFFLGVGTGENLNEHILGDHWPPYEVREEMLKESVQIMRALWEGDLHSHRGKHYTVENARIYTLPETPPEIMVAASGPESAKMAGEIGDGLISTSPKEEIVNIFNDYGGNAQRPKYGKLTVCWAETSEKAEEIAYRYWPTAGLKGMLSQELPLPQNFESAAQNVSKKDVANTLICSNDPQKFLDAVQKFTDAGFDHVYIHQVGPDQKGFFNFFEKELLPNLEVREHV